MKKKLIRYLLLGAVSAVVAACFWPSSAPRTEGPRSYESILQSGILRATTEYNAVGYFVDHDTLAGFHYELVRAFAQSKGLAAEITPVMDFQQQLNGIANGSFDLIAGSILVTSEQRDSLLSFTVPILRNRQVLVQRKPATEDDSLYIRMPLQLGGRTVYVPEHSPAVYRIHHLSMEIADSIAVREMAKYGSEQLIALVAHGDIDYAICEESIARAAIGRYPQLDISTAISFNQFYGWAVPTTATALRDTLDAWLNSYMQTRDFQRLLKKYALR